ncbi:MAG: hypothetical protein QKV58_gp1 [Avonheates virus SG_924]|uniref:hypothetical protein n=1 Tax=Avonheates virus SG_924 TaxID=2914488 RepID=UPI002481A705|nr:MAG: hypothetical protein QKV58_gp1 [Avonheates virus SG_924]UNI72604.1 MAG: hypothetical protein [Avonheates virus SG_924]
MIERHVIFENNTAYDLANTIHSVSVVFQDSVYLDEVIHKLQSARYLVDIDDFYPDLQDGTLTFRDIWFEKYGIEHVFTADTTDGMTIGTFEMELECCGDGGSINSYDEDRLVNASRVLFAMAGRVMVPSDIDFLHEEHIEDDISTVGN